MSEIKKKVTDVIKNFEKSAMNVNNEKFLKLEEADKIFKELVKKGLIKKRGNNILLPGEMPIKPNDPFNAEKSSMNSQNFPQSETKGWFF